MNILYLCQMNKCIIFILVFLSGGLLTADNVWKLIPSPVSYPMSLTKVVFMDSLTGWAAGDSGIVIHTTDGGANWDFQNTGVRKRIDDLFFLNKMKGWALSIYSEDTVYGSYVLSTTNGGITWNRDSLSFPSHYLHSIQFLDSLRGFVNSNVAPVYLTIDGGLNWQRASVDSFSSYPGEGVQFFNDTYGFAFGGLHDITLLIWKTTDGGHHWNKITYTDSIGEPISKMHFYDSLNIFAIGGDAEYGMIKWNSTNGGESWESENIGKLAIPENLSYRTESEAWVPIGFVTTFLVTKDSGKTWNEYPVPLDLTIYDISFPDSLHGYAVGLDGVILKYTHPPTSVEDDITVETVKDFSLNQNYPNPFNSSTEISFTINIKGVVELTLFDMLGRKIITLHKGELERGNYKTTLDAATLASGVYYYRLTSGHISLTRKAILLK